MEIWKPIIGYEGLYEVSSWGRIKSLNYMHTHRAFIMPLQKRKDGYIQINLSKNGKAKRYYVHRLLMTAFSPEKSKIYKEVNHKNEIKSDNRLENLEWCDKSYNVNFGTRNDRASKKLSKTILQYSLNGELIAEHKSSYEIERKLGFNRSNISSCCHGRQLTSYGYKWVYKTPNTEE